MDTVNLENAVKDEIVKSAELWAHRFGVSRMITRHELDHHRGSHEFVLRNLIAEPMVAQLFATLYGRKSPHSVTISHPEDWWQAVRLRWFPRWWLERHPVRMRRHVVSATEFYPHITVPHREAWIQIRAD